MTDMKEPLGYGVERRPVDLNKPPSDPFVYLIQHDHDGPIKIGFALGPEDRLRALQAANPFPLHLRLKLPGGEKEEACLHLRFKAHHIRGEWFHPCPELLALIKNPPESWAAYLNSSWTPDVHQSRDEHEAALQRLIRKHWPDPPVEGAKVSHT